MLSYDHDFLLDGLAVTEHKAKPLGLTGGSDGKESPCNAGDPGSNPGLRRSPGKGNGNPLQYSCLENPIDRGAWWATWSCKESDITERLTLSLSIILVNTHSIAYLPNPI